MRSTPPRTPITITKTLTPASVVYPIVTLTGCDYRFAKVTRKFLFIGSAATVNDVLLMKYWIFVEPFATL